MTQLPSNQASFQGVPQLPFPDLPGRRPAVAAHVDETTTIRNIQTLLGGVAEAAIGGGNVILDREQRQGQLARQRLAMDMARLRSEAETLELEGAEDRAALQSADFELQDLRKKMAEAEKIDALFPYGLPEGKVPTSAQQAIIGGATGIDVWNAPGTQESLLSFFEDHRARHAKMIAQSSGIDLNDDAALDEAAKNVTDEQLHAADYNITEAEFIKDFLHDRAMAIPNFYARTSFVGAAYGAFSKVQRANNAANLKAAERRNLEMVGEQAAHHIVSKWDDLTEKTGAAAAKHLTESYGKHHRIMGMFGGELTRNEVATRFYENVLSHMTSKELIGVKSLGSDPTWRTYFDSKSDFSIDRLITHVEEREQAGITTTANGKVAGIKKEIDRISELTDPGERWDYLKQMREQFYREAITPQRYLSDERLELSENGTLALVTNSPQFHEAEAMFNTSIALIEKNQAEQIQITNAMRPKGDPKYQPLREPPSYKQVNDWYESKKKNGASSVAALRSLSDLGANAGDRVPLAYVREVKDAFGAAGTRDYEAGTDLLQALSDHFPKQYKSLLEDPELAKVSAPKVMELLAGAANEQERQAIIERYDDADAWDRAYADPGPIETEDNMALGSSAWVKYTSPATIDNLGNRLAFYKDTFAPLLRSAGAKVDDDLGKQIATAPKTQHLLNDAIEVYKDEYLKLQLADPTGTAATLHEKAAKNATDTFRSRWQRVTLYDYDEDGDPQARKEWISSSPFGIGSLASGDQTQRSLWERSLGAAIQQTGVPAIAGDPVEVRGNWYMPILPHPSLQGNTEDADNVIGFLAWADRGDLGKGWVRVGGVDAAFDSQLQRIDEALKQSANMRGVSVPLPGPVEMKVSLGVAVTGVSPILAGASMLLPRFNLDHTEALLDRKEQIERFREDAKAFEAEFEDPAQEEGFINEAIAAMRGVQQGTVGARWKNLFAPLLHQRVSLKKFMDDNELGVQMVKDKNGNETSEIDWENMDPWTGQLLNTVRTEFLRTQRQHRLPNIANNDVDNKQQIESFRQFFHDFVSERLHWYVDEELF